MTKSKTQCKGGHLINLDTGTCTKCDYQAGNSVEDWQNATKDLQNDDELF